MEYRIERDSMGEVRVPADRYWGAQTQRSHENFPIGVGIETMPAEIIRAFAVLKKAAAIANRELLPARMSAEKCALIGRVCDEILAGELDGHFPLVVWQTGSGTQSNMNVNEVIANRGNELAGKSSCTQTTTSICRSPRTTPFPRRCILPPVSRWRTAFSPLFPRWSRPSCIWRRRTPTC